MDRGHNRESETGATGTSLRNAPASVHPMLAIDSQRQEEINDLHSFESCERAQRANDMVSEESHTTLRGTHPPPPKKKSIPHHSRGRRKPALCEENANLTLCFAFFFAPFGTGIKTHFLPVDERKDSRTASSNEQEDRVCISIRRKLYLPLTTWLCESRIHAFVHKTGAGA